MSLDDDDTLVAVKRVPMEEENGKPEGETPETPETPTEG